MDDLKSAKRRERQFKYLGPTQTKDGTSLREVNIRLAHSAMTRLEILWKKNKVITFLQRIESTNHLWMWEMNADLGSFHTNPSFWRQCYTKMLGISYKEDKSERICMYMAAGQYPRRPSVTIMNRQASQCIMVLSCVSSRSLPKIIVQGTVDDRRRRGKPRKWLNGQVSPCRRWCALQTT